jgi:hypothetical protein
MDQENESPLPSPREAGRRLLFHPKHSRLITFVHFVPVFYLRALIAKFKGETGCHAVHLWNNNGWGGAIGDRPLPQSGFAICTFKPALPKNRWRA